MRYLPKQAANPMFTSQIEGIGAKSHSIKTMGVVATVGAERFPPSTNEVSVVSPQILQRCELNQLYRVRTQFEPGPQSSFEVISALQALGFLVGIATASMTAYLRREPR